MQPRGRLVFKSVVYALVLLFPALSAYVEGRSARKIPDAEVRKAIIAESIRAYPGSCPCPYSTTKNGKLCGGRSAWSRKGGASPICYENEVTAEMVRQWRKRHE